MATKNLLSGCVDVLVVEQEDGRLKSTSFQVVFGYFKFNAQTKSKEVKIYINGVKSDVTMYIDSSEGRAKFLKKIPKKETYKASDSEQNSDDDRGQRKRSKSRERTFSPNSKELMETKFKARVKQLEELKNQHRPNFWYFSWFRKPQKQVQVNSLEKQLINQEQKDAKLEKIVQEDYEGEEGANDPQIMLSLCKHLLNKNLTARENLKIFYKNQIKQRDFMNDPSHYLNDQNLVVKIEESIYTWQIGLAIITCKMAFGKQLSFNHINNILEKKKGSWLSSFFKQKKFIIETEEKNLKALDIKNKNSEIEIQKQEQFIIKYSRTPSHDDLERLKLKKGLNTAKFIVSDNKKELELQCHIFLWDQNTKIIVSDIDGTITKTDILGQMMPMLDEMWIHKGIVKLFHQLSQRGYEIVYVTARAIVQYGQTRQFLFNQLKQDEFKAPLGPIFMSPQGILKSFKVEMIDKQPDFLKTQILTAIKENFPVSVRPSVLVAGFGNKMSDANAYKHTGIKKQNIFIIGENSVIQNIVIKDFKSSYPELLEQIDNFFPNLLIKIQAKENQKKQLQQSEQKKQEQILKDVIPELFYTDDRINGNS